YRWAGLDPANGDPQGYFEGEVSKDYTALSNSRGIDNLLYVGPARPVWFGAFRNTISFKQFSLSANITYKMGYYFRRNTIEYGSLFNQWVGHEDFSRRWQQPGDEQVTNVPSLVYPSVTGRNNFYRYSEIIVERGDHIRLQDVRLSYTFSRSRQSGLPVGSLNIYMYANNLGVIWKSTSSSLDPDFIEGYPDPMTIAFGIRTKF